MDAGVPVLHDRRQPHPGAADGPSSGQPCSSWSASQAGLHRHARLRRQYPRRAAHGGKKRGKSGGATCARPRRRGGGGQAGHARHRARPPLLEGDVLVPDHGDIQSAYRTTISRPSEEVSRTHSRRTFLTPVLKGVMDKSGINPAEIGDIVVGTV